MTISSSVPAPGLTVLVVTGPVSPEELRNRAVEFVRYHPTPLALWDFGQAEFSTVSSNDIRSVFDAARPFAENRRSGKTALLFSSALGYGMGRMSEAIAEHREFPYTFRSFWDREAAMQWLRAGAGEETPGTSEAQQA